MPRFDISVTEADGTCARWSGVSLESVLARAGVKIGTAVGPAEAGDYLRAVARDGSSAVFALPEFQRSFVLVAYALNGQPLSPGEGPLRLVVRDEGRRVRWVKEIQSLRVE